MTMHSSSPTPSVRSLRNSPGSPRNQRGIALFVALIVMVALSLAGVALIRSIDTTTSVTGNIAFRQAALLQANWAIEEAIGSIYTPDQSSSPDSKLSAGFDTTQDEGAKFYIASFEPTKDSTTTGQPALPAGVPDVLWKKGGAWPYAPAPDTGTGNKIKYVIQRMCTKDVYGASPKAEYCDMMAPKQALGTTVGDDALTIGKYPLYRVTVRVDGPNNSLAFVQAMIRG
jgi:type IV pilus assembly protein PilX